MKREVTVQITVKLVVEIPDKDIDRMVAEFSEAIYEVDSGEELIKHIAQIRASDQYMTFIEGIGPVGGADLPTATEQTRPCADEVDRDVEVLECKPC